MDEPLDLAAYLARIGVAPGTLAPDLATLRRLHAPHVGGIPFENVDVQAASGCGSISRRCRTS